MLKEQCTLYLLSQGFDLFGKGDTFGGEFRGIYQYNIHKLSRCVLLRTVFRQRIWRQRQIHRFHESSVILLKSCVCPCCPSQEYSCPPSLHWVPIPSFPRNRLKRTVRNSKPAESVPEAVRHVLHSSAQAQLDTCRKGFFWPSDQVTEVRTQKTHVSNLHSIPCRMTGKDSDRGETGTMVSGKTTY